MAFKPKTGWQMSPSLSKPTAILLQPHSHSHVYVPNKLPPPFTAWVLSGWPEVKLTKSLLLIKPLSITSAGNWSILLRQGNLKKERNLKYQTQLSIRTQPVELKILHKNPMTKAYACYYYH